MIQTRSQLLEAAQAPPPAELLWRDETPDWLVAAHDAKGTIPAVDVVTLAETDSGEPLVYGGRGFFRLGETIRPDLPTGPRYLKLLLRNRGPDRSPVREWIDGLSRPDLRIKHSDRPVLVCVHPNWNYGHFLIEILPRLVLLNEAAEPGLPILLAGRAPDWLVECIGHAAPGRPLLRFNPSRVAVAAPFFIGASDVFTDVGLSPGYLPRLAALTRRIAQNASGEPASARLFLSRGGLGKSRHVIENIEEIEAVAVALGYQLVRPETLSFPEQVRLMRGARIIAGQYGSAMHNAMFAPRDTTVICLNCINPIQSRLAAGLGHRVGYITPQDGIFRDDTRIGKGDRAMRFCADTVRRKLIEADAKVAASGVSH